MTYPTDQWPTMPVVWRHELPHCVGACKQGRIPCQHQLACSCTTLSDAEFDDVAAELTTDRAPLRPMDELPDITGRLTAQLDPLDQNELVLILALLVICVLVWGLAAAQLYVIWRA